LFTLSNMKNWKFYLFYLRKKEKKSFSLKKWCKKIKKLHRKVWLLFLYLIFWLRKLLFEELFSVLFLVHSTVDTHSVFVFLFIFSIFVHHFIEFFVFIYLKRNTQKKAPANTRKKYDLSDFISKFCYFFGNIKFFFF